MLVVVAILLIVVLCVETALLEVEEVEAVAGVVETDKSSVDVKLDGVNDVELVKVAF